MRWEMIKPSALRGYDRNFKMFIYVMSGIQALQVVLVTLNQEMKNAIPYITEIRQIGNISAAGRIAMAVAAFLWAYLGERYSRKLLLIIAGFISAIPFLFSIIAPNYALFFLSHVVSFVGRAAFVVLSPVIVMDMIPADGRGEASSVMGIGGLLGAGLGTVLPSFVVDLLSWKEPMLFLGMFSLSALIVLFFMEVPKRGAQERAVSDVLDEETEYCARLDLNVLKQVFAIRSNISIFISFAILQLSLGGVGYYTFTIFKEEYAMSATTTMLLVLGAQSLIMIGAAFWGPKSDEAFRRSPDGRIRTLILGSLVVTIFRALSYIALPSYKLNPWFIIGYMIFSLLASFASITALIPLMNNIVGDTSPPEIRSITISIRNFIGVTSASVGIMIVGFIQSVQGTFTWATIVISVIGLFSVFFLVPARKLIPKEMKSLGLLLEDRARSLTAEKRKNLHDQVISLV
jgi:MFS family permease